MFFLSINSSITIFFYTYIYITHGASCKSPILVSSEIGRHPWTVLLWRSDKRTGKAEREGRDGKRETRAEASPTMERSGTQWGGGVAACLLACSRPPSENRQGPKTRLETLDLHLSALGAFSLEIICLSCPAERGTGAPVGSGGTGPIMPGGSSVLLNLPSSWCTPRQTRGVPDRTAPLLRCLLADLITQLNGEASFEHSAEMMGICLPPPTQRPAATDGCTSDGGAVGGRRLEEYLG